METNAFSQFYQLLCPIPAKPADIAIGKRQSTCSKYPVLPL